MRFVRLIFGIFFAISGFGSMIMGLEGNGGAFGAGFLAFWLAYLCFKKKKTSPQPTPESDHQSTSKTASKTTSKSDSKSANKNTTESVDPVAQLITNANQLHAAEKYQEEINLLNKALDYAGSHVDYWVILGRAHRCNENYDAAMNCYEYAKTIDPENGKIYLNIGVICFLKGSYAEAIQYFELASSKKLLYEDETILLANYGLALGKSGDKKRGLDYIAQAEKRGYPNAEQIRAMMNQ